MRLQTDAVRGIRWAAMGSVLVLGLFALSRIVSAPPAEGAGIDSSTELVAGEPAGLDRGENMTSPPMVPPPPPLPGEVRRPRRHDEVALARAGRRQIRVLEAAVPDQLCVQPAVAGVADLLEEDAVERRRDGRRRGREIDGQSYGQPDPVLFADLVRGVAAAGDDLDNMIAAVLDEDWTVERLETILRAVLRAGAYELSSRPDVPPRVTISEYVDVADAFLGAKQAALVNGVLDRIARALRPDELEAPHGGLYPLS